MPRLVLWGLIYTFVLGLVLGRATVSWTPRIRSDLQSLAVEALRLDTVYLRDTVTLWRIKSRWDTAFVDVERWKTDTLRVVEYVTLADSTIRACTATVMTCEARVKVASQQVQALESRWQASQSSQRWQRWQWGVAGVGLGALLVTLRP